MNLYIKQEYLFTVSWTTPCRAGWARLGRVNLVNQKTLSSSEPSLLVEREPYLPFRTAGRRLLELSNTVIAAGRCLDQRSLHAIPAANLPYVLAVNKYEHELSS
jgi:hypothetical protein